MEAKPDRQSFMDPPMGRDAAMSLSRDPVDVARGLAMPPSEVLQGLTEDSLRRIRAFASQLGGEL